MGSACQHALRQGRIPYRHARQRAPPHLGLYPKAPGRAPVIIFRTPYGTGPLRRGRVPQPGSEKGYLRSYVDRGYIIVQQDVRGRYMSEGEFMHVRPVGFGDVDEATDSYDTVEWLVKHIPGNNGRVGFAGSSYPGFYALMGALSGHPPVKAVSPQAPVTDWYMGDDVHHNGILMLSDAVRFLNSMNTPSGHTPTDRMPRRELTFSPDDRTFFLEHPTRADLTTLLAPNAFWEEMSGHPDYDEWWRARDTRRACYNIRPAMLVVGGTYDAEDCYGAWNLYRAVVRQSAQTPVHLVVGPWSHGAWRGDGRRLGTSTSARRLPDAITWSISRRRSSTATFGPAIRSIGCLPWRSSPRATTAGMRSVAGRPPGPAG
ncbi:MAG: CocE/NonD family hydrolase [Alistipes senegalensis]